MRGGRRRVLPNPLKAVLLRAVEAPMENYRIGFADGDWAAAAPWEEICAQ
jgi:hypothetical protein